MSTSTVSSTTVWENISQMFKLMLLFCTVHDTSINTQQICGWICKSRP